MEDTFVRTLRHRWQKSSVLYRTQKQNREKRSLASIGHWTKKDFQEVLKSLSLAKVASSAALLFLTTSFFKVFCGTGSKVSAELTYPLSTAQLITSFFVTSHWLVPVTLPQAFGNQSFRIDTQIAEDYDLEFVVSHKLCTLKDTEVNTFVEPFPNRQQNSQVVPALRSAW